MVRSSLVALAIVLSWCWQAVGQDFCATYRLECQTVWDVREVQAYRIESDQVTEERQVTRYVPEWHTEQRERRYQVSRPVQETSVVNQKYTVNRAVWETKMQDVSYDRVRNVMETSETRRAVFRLAARVGDANPDGAVYGTPTGDGDVLP